MRYYVDWNRIQDDRLKFILNGIDRGTKLSDCDYIIYHNLLWADKETPISLKQISAEYKSNHQKIIIFIVDDYEMQYEYHANLILYRTSLRAKLRQVNEFTLPYIWESALSPFPPCENKVKASIGFVGQNSLHRKKIIKTFQKAKNVDSDFILRDQFWGGNPHDKDIINDFNVNMKHNPFIICQRGNGNFSMRFFQTLSAGRIPVLTNTDMLLPFSESIMWDEAIIFEKNENLCLKKVKKVYNSGAYITMQKKCVEIHNNYFTSEHLFKNIDHEIAVGVNTSEKKLNFLHKLMDVFK